MFLSCHVRVSEWIHTFYGFMFGALPAKRNILKFNFLHNDICLHFSKNDHDRTESHMDLFVKTVIIISKKSKHFSGIVRTRKGKFKWVHFKLVANSYSRSFFCRCFFSAFASLARFTCNITMVMMTFTNCNSEIYQFLLVSSNL